MKHLVSGMKSVFVGDEAADTLMDYAAHVAQFHTGDRVDLRGFTSEGNEVVTTFLLNGGTSLAAETTQLPFEERNNADAIAYMRSRIEKFQISPEFIAGFQAFDGEQVA